MSLQQDTAELAEALAAWGSRDRNYQAGEAEWAAAERALAALARIKDTYEHVEQGLRREMKTEKLLDSWRRKASSSG